MFSLCCLISVWTVSANTVQRDYKLNTTVSDFGGETTLQRNQINDSLRGLSDKFDYQTVTLLCMLDFFVLSRIPLGVCEWNGNKLQRNKIQNKIRKDLSEMGCKIPTQAKVSLHLLSILHHILL